jgi:hypothetical protein
MTQIQEKVSEGIKMLVKDNILENLNKLPENLQVEILHYSEYLLSRYSQEKQTKETSKDISSNQKQSKKRGGYGILKGKIWMSEDFDEPLEELKEYME